MTSGKEKRTSCIFTADGIRTSKTVGGVKHKYTLDGSRIVSEVWTKNNIEYFLYFIYDENGSPAGIEYRTSEYEDGEFDYYFFDKNIFGDIIGIYNENGRKICTYTYNAWGECTTEVVGSASSLELHLANEYNPFRYRGYYYDIETRYYYLQTRYYNPEWGRFLNADKQISGIGKDMRGYNMFSYCFNNPVNMLDSGGNWPRWITAAVAKVSAAATVVSMIAGAPAVTMIAATATAVSTLAYVAQSHHYDKRKAKNTDLPQTAKEAEELNWKNSNPKSDLNPNGGGPAADCHQYTSPDKSNVKYVSPDGYREAIYNSEGNIVLDSRDVGTYNFSPSGTFIGDIGHFFADILPWVAFGNDDDDPGPIANEFIRLFE